MAFTLSWLRINFTIQMGRLITTPERSVYRRKQDPGDLQRCSFLMNSGRKKEYTPVRVVCFNRMAERMERAGLKKGQVVIVVGRLNTTPYVWRGKKKYPLDVEATEIQIVRQAIPDNMRLIHKDLYDRLDPVVRDMEEVAMLELFGENVLHGDEDVLSECDRGDGVLDGDPGPDGPFTYE